MARTLTCLYGNTVFQVLRIFWSLIEHLTWVKRYPGEFSQHHSTTYHCTGLRKSLFMVWSTKNGKNVDWRSWANCSSRGWRTLWYVLKCLPRAEMLRWSQSALSATAMGPENVYLCFDTVKNGQTTNWHSWKSWFSRFERAVFILNGYLVHHSPKDIFDVTIAFLVSENVDFDILYAIL